MERITLHTTTITDMRVVQELAGLSYGEKVLTPEILGYNVSIVAKCNGKIAGFIICQFITPDDLKYTYKQLHKDEQILYITTCYVKDGYKKQKIITLLLREAIKRFGKNKTRLVPVWMDGNNSKLYTFVLEMLGFKEIKQINSYWGHQDPNCPKCNNNKYCDCSCKFYLG